MEKIIKRTIAALSLSAFISTSLIAQEIKIQGVVVDSLTREGEPFATIRVYKANNDKEPVAMGTTDLEGRFEQAVKRWRAVLSKRSNGQATIGYFSAP